MFSWLKPNEEKTLKKRHDKLLAGAFSAQRNGDIRLYAKLTDQAEAVQRELEQVKKD